MEVGTNPRWITRLIIVASILSFSILGPIGSVTLAQQEDSSREEGSRGLMPQPGPLSPEERQLLEDQISRSLDPVQPSLTGPISPAPGEALAAPVIDVWYGLNQSFGQVGTPQNWVNILGNVTADEGLTSLEYSLNGGPIVPLATGPDDRRLAEPGDFNVDLAITGLLEGPNQVVITATDGLSAQTTATVTVDYSGVNVWPLPYSVDWDNVTDVQDVTQIVDGKWEILAGGLRTTQIDYDRVIDFGDLAWDNYEITTTVTLHGTEDPGPLGGNSGGMGFTARWPGHSDEPASAAGYQPKAGWLPSGAACFYNVSPARVGIDDQIDDSVSIGIGDTVNWKFRVETPPGFMGRYSAKVWPLGEPEPDTWNIVKVRGFEDESNGSLLFYAHHTDVTLGDVQIVEIPMSIGNVQVLNTTSTTALVSWTTTEPATSMVNFGPTGAYGQFESDATLVTDHSVTLTGLSPDSEYHFEIVSTNAGSFEARTEDMVFNTTLSTLVSDDFNNCEINLGLWTPIDPRSDSIIRVDGTRLQISVPGSETVGHGAWGTGPGDFANTLPRLMQPANDTDFQIEVKFESGLDTEFQDQGVLIQQDDNDLMLVEFTRNANNDTRVRALKVVNGEGGNLGDWGIPIAASGAAPLYMRINRTGDIWTISYSLDGSVWQVYKVVEYVLAVSSVGIFAGNGGLPVPAVTAQVDYFFNSASPIDPEDPIVRAAPVLAVIGNQAMDPDDSLTINLSATDGDSDPITLAQSGLPAFGSFSDFGDGTGEIVLNPGPGDIGDFEITVTATDSPCGLFDYETFTVHVGTIELSTLVSDDFNECTLNTGLWSTFDPDGDATFNVNGSQATISIPAGTTHDLWGNGPGDFADNIPRLMQPANDVDFAIEARFESPLTTSFQSQGFIIQQDALNLLRFEFGVNSSAETTIAVYKIVDGDGSNIGGWGTEIAAAGTSPLRLKTQRMGNLWTVSYSINDGGDWIVFQTFTHVMTVASAGVHCGNGGQAQPAHTAIVDYFFNLNSPISPEDPIVRNAPVLAEIGDQILAENESLTVGVSATDLDLDPLTLTASGLPGFASFTDYGDGTGDLELNPLATDTGTYPITITATDPCGLFDSETITVTVGTVVESNLVSDDFNCARLNEDLWTFVNPLSDATIAFNGTQAVVSLPGGGLIHDIWGTGPGDFTDTMVRLEQATTDTVFEIEARFESGLDSPWQSQGIMVSQDENDLLRMEFNYSGGDSTEIVVYKMNDGSASNIGGWGTGVALPGAQPLLMRVNCQIDQWVVSYSIDDGQNWVEYQAFTHVMNVSAAGVHFGNSDNPVPAMTGIVDYFFNTASPIVPEDGLTFNSPVLAEITDSNVTELEILNIPVSATDPDGDPIVLSTAGLPAFGMFTDNGNGTGMLNFAPQIGDFGYYPIQVIASDPCAVPDTMLFTLTVISESATAIVSDDFNSCTINTALWGWTDPRGDSARMASGAQLLISLPSDVSHSLSGTGVGDFANNVARLAQPILDGDFGMEVSFESGLTEVGQGQGILVQQDLDDLLVVDFVSITSGQTSLRARKFESGAATEIGLANIGAAGVSPLAVQVDRVGDNWTISYSLDNGASWPVFQNFTHSMGISVVGVLASNEGAPAPAHSVVVDYFFNQASPISPEDPVACPAPDGITDLVIGSVIAGSDSDGTLPINLSWTAVSCALAVDIYRKPYGNYPSYAGGSIPTTPDSPAQALAEGWELAATVPATLAGYQDEPFGRDYWYYVAMVRNGCGDISATSNQPEGVLNYLLGDVFDDVTPGTGNNEVSAEDITMLGSGYGVDSLNPAYLDFLDVGPTVSGSPTSRPQPDNQIEFEDLIIFSINYGSGTGGPASAPNNPKDPLPTTNQVALITQSLPLVGLTFNVDVFLRGNGDLQAVRIPVVWDDEVIELMDLQVGEFMDQQSVPGVILQPEPGVIDAALLGVGEIGLSGRGILATLTFQVVGSGSPRLALADMQGRDKQNQEIPVEELVVTDVDNRTPTPQTTTLFQNAPNPFNPMTKVSFEMAQAGRVRVRVYGLNGALINTLLDEDLPAGHYDRMWDGKDTSGRKVASGTYLLRLETPTTVQSKRMMLLK